MEELPTLSPEIVRRYPVRAIHHEVSSTIEARPPIDFDDEQLQRAYEVSLAPTGNSASHLYAQLRAHFGMIGLTRVKVPPYGNCLFEALICAMQQHLFIDSNGVDRKSVV